MAGLRVAASVAGAGERKLEIVSIMYKQSRRTGVRAQLEQLAECTFAKWRPFGDYHLEGAHALPSNLPIMVGTERVKRRERTRRQVRQG